MKKAQELLPFSIIAAASHGDVNAINTILKYYEGYITVLSRRMIYDAAGNGHIIVDKDLQRRLETRLITKILEFRVA